MNILKASWGGKGEHAILDVDMTVIESGIIFSLIEKSYNDWSGNSILQSEIKKEKKIELNGERITVQYIYEILDDWIRNECNMIYYNINVEDVTYKS